MSYTIEAGEVQKETQNTVISRNSKTFKELKIWSKSNLNLCDDVIDMDKEILENSFVKVRNKNDINKDENNILIHPVGVNKLGNELFLQNKINVIHFNKKISGTARNGYIEIDKFDHVVHIIDPITTSLASEKKCLPYLLLGALNMLK